MALVGAQFVNAVSPNPVGSLQAFAGADAPYGWLLCNGAETLITTYPELYSVLGTTYGALTNGSGGSGSTHFRLPDLRGRMPIGAGNDGTAANNEARTRGAKGGDTRLQAHNHSITTSESGYVGMASGGSNEIVQTTGSRHYTFFGWTVGAHDRSQGAAENMPPFIVTNYIIKAIPDAPRSGLAYGSTPPIVTALPANPQFGDVVTYIADAANGVTWNLQYDATGTYPWKFIGGSGLFNSNSNYPASQSNVNYTAINSGPSVGIQLPGDYIARHWGQIDVVNPVRELIFLVSPATATVAASDEGAANIGSDAGYTGFKRSSWYSERRMNGVLGGETIVLQQKYAVGVQTAVFHKCGLDVTPVRVKAA